MNALADIQRSLRDALVRGACPATLIRGASGEREARFAIYASAYRARLIGALRENYPVLWAVLGDEAFDALASGYLDAFPSTHPSIRWFGAHLHDFVCNEPDRLPHPALADLIRMEWALRAAFDAADDQPLQAAALASLAPDDWPGLRFCAHASVSLLRMDWALEPLWHAIQNDPAGDTEPPQAHTHSLLIWREGLETRFRSLEPPAAAFLSALITGQTFASACAACAEHLPDASQSTGLVAGCLQQFLQDGIFRSAITP